MGGGGGGAFVPPVNAGSAKRLMGAPGLIMTGAKKAQGVLNDHITDLEESVRRSQNRLAAASNEPGAEPPATGVEETVQRQALTQYTMILVSGC